MNAPLIRSKAHKPVTIEGRTFDLIRHPARGARGLAWSAYETSSGESFRYFQTRTRWELIEAVTLALKPASGAALKTALRGELR